MVSVKEIEIISATAWDKVKQFTADVKITLDDNRTAQFGFWFDLNVDSRKLCGSLINVHNYSIRENFLQYDSKIEEIEFKTHKYSLDFFKFREG